MTRAFNGRHARDGTRPRPTGGAACRCFVVLLLIACMAACRSEDEPHVVLYVSADEHVAREVITAFEAETGIRVRTVGDTEARKTTGLAERLRAERGAPRADVFWSSEIFMTIELADEGVLAPLEIEEAATWPSVFRDPEGRWFGFGARGRVIVFAPDRVDADTRPATWTDLTQPVYRGRIVMADPRFGTTGGHLGAMKVHWDMQLPGFYEAFLLGLRDNEVRLLTSGNAGVVRAVAMGEADVGLTDTDDVWAARAQGYDVDLVFPAHTHEPDPGNGTLLIPNTVARVAGGPNPEAAERLIRFLLSPENEGRLARSVSRNMPLRPGLAESFPETRIPDPLRIDYARAAAARRDAIAEAMRILAGPNDAR